MTCREAAHPGVMNVDASHTEDRCRGDCSANKHPPPLLRLTARRHRRSILIPQLRRTHDRRARCALPVWERDLRTARRHCRVRPTFNETQPQHLESSPLSSPPVVDVVAGRRRRVASRRAAVARDSDGIFAVRAASSAERQDGVDRVRQPTESLTDVRSMSLSKDDDPVELPPPAAPYASSVHGITSSRSVTSHSHRCLVIHRTTESSTA